VDVTELTHNVGRQFVREDSLKGLSDGQVMPGKVRWSVAYYGLKEMNKALVIALIHNIAFTNPTRRRTRLMNGSIEYLETYKI
jgi:hypothetical protein